MFRLVVTGIKQALSRSKRAIRGLDDFRQYFREFVRPAYFNEVERIFRTKGGSQKWAPRADGSTRNLLIRTGRLKRSYTGGANYSERITKASFSAGSTLDYATYIEEGTRNMPARQILAELARSKSFRRTLIRGGNKFVETKVIKLFD